MIVNCIIFLGRLSPSPVCWALVWFFLGGFPSQPLGSVLCSTLVSCVVPHLRSSIFLDLGHPLSRCWAGFLPLVRTEFGLYWGLSLEVGTPQVSWPPWVILCVDACGAIPFGFHGPHPLDPRDSSWSIRWGTWSSSARPPLLVILSEDGWCIPWDVCRPGCFDLIVPNSFSLSICPSSSVRFVLGWSASGHSLVSFTSHCLSTSSPALVVGIICGNGWRVP